MPVAADRKKFLPGWNTCCCLKVEEDIEKDGNFTEEYYAFSNALVKMCHI